MFVEWINEYVQEHENNDDTLEIRYLGDFGRVSIDKIAKTCYQALKMSIGK